MRIAWSAIRGVFRGWGISAREELTSWLQSDGFPATQPGNHTSVRVQEYLFTEACNFDVRVALFEVVFVTVTVHMGRELATHGQAPSGRAVPGFQVTSRSSDVRSPNLNWAQLNQLNMEALFLGVHVEEGRLRQSFSFMLQERFRAKLQGDVEAESRSWKLFGLLPMILLHRPRGTGMVGRSELIQRFEDFQRGVWVPLIHQACAGILVGSRRTEKSDEETRRGKAAQRRVQHGQVSRARHELTGAPLAPRDGQTLH